MFGMGFFEIFLVLIVAIIALGPEKLPGAAVEVVKFFKKFKSGLEEAKSTLDSELNLSEMKKEADNFKASISDVTSSVNDATSSLNANLDEIGDSVNDMDAEKVKQASPAEIHRKQMQAQSNAQAKAAEEAAAKEVAKESVAKKETISFDQGKA